MSDEYGRSHAFNRDNLVDESLNTNPNLTLDERTKNYPSEGDTTSSGGYSATSNIWTDKAQRGNISFALERDPNSNFASRNGSQTNLIDQSLSGADLSGQLRDAKQGVDKGTRKEIEKEEREDLGPGA
ncbi:hypothetical protein K435DRAFT_782510 [Dendrothele bispora CBS 962.96]|uniref:Uncharacterized protein n=1 Tax=Dendrothele bispora (strain CBS 962.96) TaxID=1314807 RepID=A0A4S8LEI0_DENBC|nr:hypothetical protein K435DRAFT_782510 [Dendrothele bispora CBS 962.96]